MNIIPISKVFHTIEADVASTYDHELVGYGPKFGHNVTFKLDGDSVQVQHVFIPAGYHNTYEVARTVVCSKEHARYLYTSIIKSKWFRKP